MTADAPNVATREVWLKARLALMEEEKALTRARDALAVRRRELPAVRVEADYRFEGEGGSVPFVALFGRHSQLIVYHFMFGPDWQEGCKSCSFWADHFSAALPHLAARDVAFAAVSRAPLARLLAFRQRMGWRFDWYSSLASRFNFDFGVSFAPAAEGAPNRYNFGTIDFSGSEAPGFSVFLRSGDDTILHTYSAYARGLDSLNGTYQLLDLTPKGRNEGGLPWPMAWVRFNDGYQTAL